MKGVERAARAVLRRIHGLVVAGPLGGQFDDIAVGIAEIDRIDELVIRDATGLDAGGLAFAIIFSSTLPGRLATGSGTVSADIAPGF